jgi:hypothetical protein
LNEIIETEQPTNRTRKGWLVMAGLVAAGAALTGGGVFASWNATTSNSTGAVNSADLGLTYADANGTTFNSTVSDLLPGDYLYRYGNLTNTGTVAEDFTAAVTGSGAITAAGGLQLSVDKCSVAWASNGTCSGTTTALVTTRDVASAGTVALDTIAGSGVSRLRYKFILPSGAASTFKNTTGSVSVALAGTASVAGGRDRSAG